MRRKDTPSVVVMEDYMEDFVQPPGEATVGMKQEVVKKGGSTEGVQDCPDCL